MNRGCLKWRGSGGFDVCYDESLFKPREAPDARMPILARKAAVARNTCRQKIRLAGSIPDLPTSFLP